MPALRRGDLAADPIEQFGGWFDVALEEVPLAEAMTLATVDADGAPDARMVLLKGFGPDGFRFFTNYESAKAGQLDGAPRAALILYWRELDRQVRIRGSVERLPDEDSDLYFATRPHDSKIGAWASPQSRPLRVALGAGRAGRRGRAALRGGRRPQAAPLGRVPAAARGGRVLAGPGWPPARPLPLHALRRGLGARAPGPLAWRLASPPRAWRTPRARRGRRSAARRGCRRSGPSEPSRRGPGRSPACPRRG